MAIYTAVNTVENITQSAAQDTLELTGTAVIQTGDSFNGGLDIDEVLVKSLTGVTVDARAASFTSYEAVRFNNTSGTSRLDVNATQLPLNMLLSGVTGTAQQLHLYANVHGQTIDLTNLTTFNWGSEDLIVVYGSAGNDTLTGSNKIDQLGGGAGNDTFFVQTVGDTVSELVGEGTDTVNASISFTLGANVENLVLTGTDNNSATGNSGNNSITGNSGNNTIDGAGGTDSMAGGQGNDTYIVDDATDTVTEGVAAGTDTVNASVSYTLTANVENLVLTGVAAINGTGNDLANVLTGNAANNTLSGGIGNDTLNGNGGTDTMLGGTGDDAYTVDDSTDVVTELVGEGTDSVTSSITYTLTSDVENLTLTGTTDLNGTGNALNNILVGNTGKNILTGGDGNDTYYVQTSSDVVVETSSTGGVDTVYAAGGFSLGNNVENLVLQSLTGVTATGNGNSLNNTITGGAGNDQIDGKAGTDTMAGGLGDDNYYVDNGMDVVTEAANAGTDRVNSSVNFTLATNFEDLTLTGSGDINGTGNSVNNVINGNTGDNILTGGGGNDTLDGRTGTDNMKGGAGHDIYWVDNVGDLVDETGGWGTDLVNSSVNYTLTTDVENLILLGSAVSGTGNAVDNKLTGNNANNTLTGLDGNDTLDGKSGADTMVGGTGNDIYVIDNALDVATENASEGTDRADTKVDYTLAANIENLTMLGTSGINGTGNSLDNIITGNIGRNQLFGMDGNDTLNGGQAVDQMTGGNGNDTYYVDNVGDVVTEAAGVGTGTDTVFSTQTYTLSANVENLTLTGSTNRNATGNADANIITGNTGNNVLDGKGGADTLAGGLGNDTYVVDASDSLVEASGGGTDLVRADFTYTLSTTQEIENLTLYGTAAINGTGNTLGNVITGNSGINTLSGLAGNDTILGLGGNDFLAGGSGTDTLTGGLGNDTFVFSALSDSRTTEGIDTISDFATGDIINVSAIDANTGVAGDQAFVADTNGTFVAGEYSVSLPDTNGFVTVNFYNDAVAGADMTIIVKANILVDGDFTL